MNKEQISVVLGLQYGDEGKGKFSDLLSTNYDYIVRYQGGDNAGHSIHFNNKKFLLRLIPSGIFQKKKVVIGNGCVVNVQSLIDEIKYLEENQIGTQDLIYISDKAHVVFNYHIVIDQINEKRKDKNKIGTTCRGIGPCYTDKFARIGIRIIDLFDFEELTKKIKINLDEKKFYFMQNEFELMDYQEIAKRYYAYGQEIKKYVCNTSKLLNDAILDNKKILLEGAQGAMLDIDFGTYPFVTSSSVTGAMASGSGIGITKINNVLGIVKAYTTRVGQGFFCTEIADEKLCEIIRIKGNEYGSVTKRPRRIGWIDIVALKYAIEISGANEIAITLIDVLSGLDEIKICTKYRFNNTEIDYLPSDINQYEKCEPIYITMQGWNEEISNINSYNDLPFECKLYIKKIEELLNTKITYISVGPEKNQTIKV